MTKKPSGFGNSTTGTKIQIVAVATKSKNATDWVKEAADRAAATSVVRAAAGGTRAYHPNLCPRGDNSNARGCPALDD